MSKPEYVLLARLARPQGRRGEILADILTDFPERFAERKQLFLLPADGAGATPRAVELETHWLHKGRVVLKFHGIDSINQAEELRGMAVAIPADARAPLEEGAVYIGDLLGCHLIDETGDTARNVGEIIDVEREPVTADLLVVKTPENAEVLVPFAKAYLRRVDLAARQVVMALPEGLLAINAPLTEAERGEMAQSSEPDPEDAETDGAE